MLLLGAAAISGFTLLRELYPYDEGQILLAARRVAQGDWPYADFVFPYGPGHPLLLGSLEELLGPSLLWWRIVRVCADAAVALVVFVLVRREAPLPVALVAWLIAAAAMAQPGGSNPFAVAIALGLCAFAVATAEPPRAGRDTWRRCAAAGGLVALAGFWRVDFGLFAGLAVVVALALAPGERALRVRAVGTFTLTAAGLGLALYAPFAIAAGPGTLYEQMVADGVEVRVVLDVALPARVRRGLSPLAAGGARRGPQGPRRLLRSAGPRRRVGRGSRCVPRALALRKSDPGAGSVCWSSLSGPPPTCAAAPTSFTPSRCSWR